MKKYCINLIEGFNKNKCAKNRQETTFSACKKCNDRCYPIINKKEPKKANKPLNKVSKKNTVKKYTDIPKSVKLKVHERDKGRCIFCHIPVSWHYANSHFIKRSQLGMGIEENIFCACTKCHNKFDDSIDRENMVIKAEKYLKSKYKNWDIDKLRYKKGTKLCQKN